MGGSGPKTNQHNPFGRWNTKPSVQSSTITQVFHIPAEERKGLNIKGFVSGDANKKLTSIEANCGAKIEMSSSKDRSLTFLITGKPDAVLRAKKEVLVEFQNQANATINIPKEHHRFLLGKGGMKLQELEKNTATKITIPKANDQNDGILVVGVKEGIEKALHEIQMISDEQSKQAFEKLEIPKIYHPFIQGAGIQKISQNLQKVHIVFNDDDTIKVDGPPDEVEKAKTELEAQASVLIKTMAFADVKVDAKYHKHIIGKGGSTINKIKSETDVTINIPDTDSGVTVIRTEGNKAGVEKASKELNGMVDKMENEKEKDLIIENRFHRQLIGPKGENIEKIRKDFANVQISFPDLGVKSDIVKLRGPKKDVDDCSKYFNKLTFSIPG